MSLRVTLKESLSGFAKNVNHLDGEKVLIEQNGVSWPDSYVRIQGKGMPIHNSPGDKGDLMVKLKLFLPSKLTAEQREAVSRIL